MSRNMPKLAIRPEGRCFENSQNKAIKFSLDKVALSTVFNALLLPVFTGTISVKDL